MTKKTGFSLPFIITTNCSIARVYAQALTVMLPKKDFQQQRNHEADCCANGGEDNRSQDFV